MEAVVLIGVGIPARSLQDTPLVSAKIEEKPDQHEKGD